MADNIPLDLSKKSIIRQNRGEIQTQINQTENGALDLRIPKRKINELNVTAENEAKKQKTVEEKPYSIQVDGTVKKWKNVAEEKHYKVRFNENKAGKILFYFSVIIS